MAIVNGGSNISPEYLGGAGGADPQAIQGKLTILTGTLTNEASDSDTSTYHLGALPSDCYLHEMTFFDVENDGFAAIRIGTRADNDALVSVAKSAGNTVSPIAVGDANHGKPLWEVLGLAENPGGKIDIYKHAVANAAGAGSMPYRLAYIHRA